LVLSVELDVGCGAVGSPASSPPPKGTTRTSHTQRPVRATAAGRTNHHGSAGLHDGLDKKKR